MTKTILEQWAVHTQGRAIITCLSLYCPPKKNAPIERT